MTDDVAAGSSSPLDSSPVPRRQTVGLVAGVFTLSTAAGAYEIAPVDGIRMDDRGSRWRSSASETIRKHR